MSDGNPTLTRPLRVAIVDDEPYQEGEPEAADADGQADEDTPDDPDAVSVEDSEDAS